MTKRDFFVLVFKLLALYGLVITAFSLLPATISYNILMDDMSMTLIVAAAAILVFVIFFLLLSQSGNLVNWLKLDKGFDEDRIDFQHLSPEHIIKLGAFIIGGFLLVDNLPLFVSYTIDGFSRDLQHLEQIETNNVPWAMSFINLILGYFMITNLQWIADRLKVKKSEESSELEGE